MSASTGPARAASLEFDFTPDVIKEDSAAGVTIDVETAPNGLVARLLAGEPLPERDLALLDGQLRATGNRDIVFDAAKGAVVFRGSASAFLGLSVASDPLDALRTRGFAPAAELDLAFPPPTNARYLALTWGYDLRGAANGAVALGHLGDVKFGMETAREGFLAVVRRFPAETIARDAIARLFQSWRLPSQVDASRLDQSLAPATWLIAEVDGSFGLRLGAEFGYNFNWVREFEKGGLRGELGLKVQIAANATLGFHASGRYVLVLGRESSELASKAVRLRLLKLNKRGWGFALNAGVTVDVQTTGLPDTADEFIQALFGLTGAQIVKDLLVLEEWTDPDRDLPGLLADLGADYSKQLIARLAGVEEAELPKELAETRDTILGFLKKWNALPNRMAASLWKSIERWGVSSPQIAEIRELAEALAVADRDALESLIDQKLATVSFFQTPACRWLESLTARGVLSLLDDISGLQRAAGVTAELLRDDTVPIVLTSLQQWINNRLRIEDFRTAADEASFENLDRWLRVKFAAFLGAEVEALTNEQLEEIRQAINLILVKRQDFYRAAAKALNRRYSASFSAGYQRTRVGAALIDAEFDLARDDGGQLGRLLAEAIDGDFRNVLLTAPEGVRLRRGQLVHGVERSSFVDLSLPFFQSRFEHVNEAIAQFQVFEEDGAVVYDLAAVDDAQSASRRRHRESRLMISARIPALNGTAVRVFDRQRSALSYSFHDWRLGARRSQLERQIRPFLDVYFGPSFSFPDGASSLKDWLFALDQYIDERDENGPNLFGNTLLSLEVRYDEDPLRAWFQAPANRQDAAYLALSRRIQSLLKELIPFFFFRDIEEYRNFHVAAAPLILYSAIPPLNTVDSQGIANTSDLHWATQADARRRAVVESERTLAGLFRQLHQISERLAEEGMDERIRRFYLPDPDNARNLRTAAFEGQGANHFLALIAMESRIVSEAREAGLALAKFRKLRSKKEIDGAIQALEQFGSHIANAFNNVGKVYGRGALRPLGPMVLTESSRALLPDAVAPDSQDDPDASAVLRLTVLHSGITDPPAGFPDHEVPRNENPADANPVVAEQLLVRTASHAG